MLSRKARWFWTATLIALGLAAVPACDDGGTSGGSGDAGTDTDTDSDADLVPIASFGTTDLDFNLTPLPDPKADMPPLENLDPEFTPALGSQALPGTGTEIYEAEQAGWYVGYSTDALEATLRADGVARQPNDSTRELMAEALIGVADSSEKPGVLLTSDAVLNTFHNFYDNVLLGVELETLRPRLLAALGAVKAEAAKRYNALPTGPTKDAALDVVAYLQVAESLMEPESGGIEEAWDVSSDEIQQVNDLGAVFLGEFTPRVPSPLFDRPEVSVPGHPECGDCNPCVGMPDLGGCGWYEGTGEDLELVICPERYCEDYSQYKPRGHYTYNEALERYFRAVMWLGRMTFLNRSDQSTRGAVVLVDSLKDAQVDIDGGTVPAADVWRQAMRAIGAFVGSMDDLNANEIDAAVMQAMGGAFTLDALDDTVAVDAIHAEIAQLHDPEILSGFLSALADAATETKGLRLLGQVYLPDSYATGQLVFGNVGPSATADPVGYEEKLFGCSIPAGTDPEALTPEQANCVCVSAWGGVEPFWDVCRGLPSGLDVASVLGSSFAQDLALERFGSYAGYPEKLSELIAEFAGFDVERWGLSIGWTWLYALQELLADTDPGAPAFMRTDAWDKKNLETGLTSWAELRHDTILYVKQSYTSSDTDADTDTDADIDYDFEYVEPHPRAYARLEAATRRLETLAVDEALISDDSGSVMIALDQMQQFLARATEISVTELEGGELSGSDVGWIRSSGSQISSLENGLLDGLGLYDDEHEPDPDRLKTTIVADVHTWPSKEVVLEVGSGYLDYVAVLHRLPGGQWGVAVGPAFTYHEFEHDMLDRLTDEQWREILEGDPDTGHPDWLD